MAQVCRLLSESLQLGFDAGHGRKDAHGKAEPAFTEVGSKAK